MDKSELNESGMQCPSFITNHLQVIYTGMRPVEAIVAGRGGNAAHVAHGERGKRSVAQGTRERLQAAHNTRAVTSGAQHNLELATLTLERGNG